MAQYIDKSALAAEIKKLIKRYKTFQPHSSYEDGLKEGRLIGYEDALCKINTLEVKEAKSTDTFIEKATSYIQQYWIWNTKMIEQFKNYMKGE